MTSQNSTASERFPRSLVLASTSPYRRRLLQRLGVPFETCAPACDEEALKAPQLSPQALSEMLAQAKATSVRDRFPSSVIIGSDQVCAFGERILGKPGNRETAIETLHSMQGLSHQLITSTCILVENERFTQTNITTLTMRPLSREQIERYVDRDQPFDCAGSYKLEQGGIALFASIDSEDETAIMGLPLIRLGDVLSDLGFVFP